MPRIKTRNAERGTRNGKHERNDHVHLNGKSKGSPQASLRRQPGVVQAKEQTSTPEDLEGTRPVPIARIIKSPTNPRKAFDETKLAELAASIKAKGVLQPILVRPAKNWRVVPGKQSGKPGFLLENSRASLLDGEFFETDEKAANAKAPRYELVAGERRLRAAQLAGLTSIPAVIRDLSDREALEVQVIENEQREDIPPLEKADGYAALLRTGATVEALAEKIGKSVSTIRGLLKLQELPAIAREAVIAGQLPSHTAQLIARVPGQVERAEVAIRVISDGTHNGKPERGNGLGKGLAIARGCIERGEPPMSHRDARDMLHRDYMLELKGAPFSRVALDLVEGATSCDACPKRVGNLQQQDPEGYQGLRGDICTDPACYRSKCDAHRQRQADALKAKGLNVLDAATAAKIFGRYETSGTPLFNCGWVNLDKCCYDDKKKRTFAAILGDDLKQQTHQAFDRQGRAWPVARVEVVTPALKKKGIKATSHGTGAGAAPGSSEKYEERYRQEEEERRQAELRGVVIERALPLVAAAAEKLGGRLINGALRPGEPAMQLLRTLVLELLGNSWGLGSPYRLIAQRRQLKPSSEHDQAVPLRKLAATASAFELVGLAVEATVALRLASGTPSPGVALCDLLGVDLKALEAAAKKDLAAKAKAASEAEAQRGAKAGAA